MSHIVLPKKVTFTELKAEHQGQVVIEPCYPGYGTTLGNSLRRVLFSSLPGAAVVSVKIKNADHEFATLDGVKEDILEIILNLKKLRLKIFSEGEETIKFELKASGIRKVTAADITKNSQVEIINQDLHILEITDKKTNIEMEIAVAKGYGYQPIETRENQEKEVGCIDIDSVFSPVQAVKVEVENVRVGKMTNWEKLIIDITTDGTISFKEAYRDVAKILVDQFSFLLEAGEAELGNKAKKSSKKDKSEDETEEKEDEPEESVASNDEVSESEK